jgi:hypothetical protein
LITNGSYEWRGSPGDNAEGIFLASGLVLTAVVLAITTYLGDMRLLGFLAVFTAILAVLFARTITSRMRALIRLAL